MKNITVSVDEETYRLARIRAAEAGTSVSAMVRTYLEGLTETEDSALVHQRMNRLREDILNKYVARSGGLRMSDNLSRDELHDRDALR
ncbi:MAG: hypothetical protein OXC99_11935 [Chloroflexi bacterium]|nr:hypothetical protein [Chloroflexota bacterium]